MPLDVFEELLRQKSVDQYVKSTCKQLQCMIRQGDVLYWATDNKAQEKPLIKGLRAEGFIVSRDRDMLRIKRRG